MVKPKIIPAIVGPTGVGKTAYALHLAPKINAEIISADSRQVFIGMDIATGKESDRGSWTTINDQRTLIIDSTPIHALDLVTPDHEFSVSQWHDTATRLIEEITQRGKQPFIVGGTGFYLDAIMGHIQTMDIPPNPELRVELQKLNRTQLQNHLQDLNASRWESLNFSDQNNPARLMRAIEVEMARRQDGKVKILNQVQDDGIQNPIPESRDVYNSVINNRKSKIDLQMVGLTMPRDQLYTKIDTRLDHMLDQGLIYETKQLIEQYGRQPQSMTSLGYAEIANYLDGETNLATAMQLFKNRVHAFARRQYTWFNHRPVTWIDISQPDWQKQADALIMPISQPSTSSL